MNIDYNSVMAEPLRRRATYQDVLDAPAHVVAEIVAGDLHTSPRPAAPHARARSALGMDLGSPFDRGRGGPGGWWILFEPELHLGEHVLVPDLAGCRRERLPVIADVPYFELAPDWICEVLSESTMRLDRIRKLPIYAECGVAYAWLVDPIARTLEVFRLEAERWVLIGTYEGDDEIRAEPFDAVPLQLSGLWTGPSVADDDGR